MNAGTGGAHLAGEQVSLWVATAGRSDYPRPVDAVDVDVAAIGGGVVESTAVLVLNPAGRRVAVFEAARRRLAEPPQHEHGKPHRYGPEQQPPARLSREGLQRAALVRVGATGPERHPRRQICDGEMDKAMVRAGGLVTPRGRHRGGGCVHLK
jgi:hypothetical protein